MRQPARGQKQRHHASDSHPNVALTLVLPIAAIAASLLLFSVIPAAAASRQQPEDSTHTDESSQLISSNHKQQQQQQQHQSASSRQPAAVRQPANHQLNGRQFGDTISDIHIECNSDSIVLTLNTNNNGFNGMIYPKGLSKNSSCMTEYHQLASNITYHLPLKSCNTMSTDVNNGIEYFNTIIIQPHRRLVTNQGRGYHIRCRYETKEKTIVTQQFQQLSVNLSHQQQLQQQQQQQTPIVGLAPVPECSMKIYRGDDFEREIMAENVRIGDQLHLQIKLDEQEVYGMLVTNCLVRDGMNWGEQPLIDNNGCPVDEEIMPQFTYNLNRTQAQVSFQAHKFPYTSSVYYQCNVRLCFREGNCNYLTPPNCDQQPPSVAANDVAALLPAGEHNPAAANRIDANQRQRFRRWLDAGDLEGVGALEEAQQQAAPGLSIQVASGLLVDERQLFRSDRAADGAEAEDPMVMASTNDDPSEQIGAKSNDDQQADKSTSDRELCLTLRKFAIIVTLASLLLMLAFIIMVACILHRRKMRNKQPATQSEYSYRS